MIANQQQDVFPPFFKLSTTAEHHDHFQKLISNIEEIRPGKKLKTIEDATIFGHSLMYSTNNFYLGCWFGCVFLRRPGAIFYRFRSKLCLQNPYLMIRPLPQYPDQPAHIPRAGGHSPQEILRLQGITINMVRIVANFCSPQMEGAGGRRHFLLVCCSPCTLYTVHCVQYSGSLPLSQSIFRLKSRCLKFSVTH